VVEVVYIFRRPEEVMPVVDGAISIGVKAMWIQELVIKEAAAKARDDGLLVVMDKFMRKERIRINRKRKTV
jgi:predicted CoA-binding protein